MKGMFLMSVQDMQVLEEKISKGKKKEKENKIKEIKKELKKKSDGFFADFKKFITRGNVLDMAVGVIVGGAFTAIINALSNNILKPIINWILAMVLGKDTLSEVYTFLTTAYKTADDGTRIIDLENSIYIDWGMFINAIINFLLIAFTLFVIVRIINNVRKKIDAMDKAEIAAKRAEEEKKAAEEKAKKAAEAEAAALAAEKATAEKAALEQMYQNIARQTELLEKLANK